MFVCVNYLEGTRMTLKASEKDRILDKSILKAVNIYISLLTTKLMNYPRSVSSVN